ncbi:MAG: sigma-70 family RNA polymerase sigma factor [Chloroflexota bacterium]|nr:MAG: sigma-70 family RNA polymerase sigma factor [Chloroflexota bacterium]
MISDAEDKPIVLEALRNGDRAEFARLVETYSPMIYRLGLKMLNNPQDAEDILQETFIKAYKHIGNFDGRSNVSTWLYRIATNEALMSLRRKHPEIISFEKPTTYESEPQEPLQIVDWCCLPEEEFLTAEVRDRLNEAAARLPANLRVVFVLRDIEGLSTRETSQVLDISEMAVKTRLSRARLRLREDLSEYFDKLMDKD